MKKPRLFYGLFVILTITCLFLMVSGCSPNEPVAPDPFPEMPDTLRTLQGTWIPSTTNCCNEGSAIIDGYTVRIRYQENTNSALLKHNASIERVDAPRKLLVLNGGTAAWPYFHRKEGNKELLDIEFFSHSGWNKISLQRGPGQASVTQ